jgi:hypothetical protein
MDEALLAWEMWEQTSIEVRRRLVERKAALQATLAEIDRATAVIDLALARVLDVTTPAVCGERPLMTARRSPDSPPCASTELRFERVEPPLAHERSPYELVERRFLEVASTSSSTGVRERGTEGHHDGEGGAPAQ